MTRTTLHTWTRPLQRPRLAWTITHDLAIMSPMFAATWRLTPFAAAAPRTLHPTWSVATLVTLGRDHRDSG